MSASWHLYLLGRAKLDGPSLSAWRPERKVFACLAYLALEDGAHRSRLAGLLWPDSPEATARNNLSQTLHKLRLATRAELVTGKERLSLAPEVQVDAVRAGELFAQGRYAEMLAFKGALLADQRYDDLPDLEDWVLAERERMGEWRAQALRHEAAGSEHQGQFEAALDLVWELLEHDPASEDAYRRLMRLHYLRGDRPAALRAYHRCREVLRREFGVEPLPETQHLAQEIDRGTVRVTTGVPRKPELPLAVLRPPELVGRKLEWAALEAAWAERHFIFIGGEPGVGKSRLARDFLASKGEYILFEGRPGDAHVPGSTSARVMRKLHARRPDLPLTTWVRREVQRFVPELAQEGEVAPPLTSDEEAVRFRQALLAFSLLANEGLAAQLLDDWQFFDETSNQLGEFVFTSAEAEQRGRLPRLVFTFRQGELSPGNQRHLDRLVEGGYAVLITLRPLADDAVTTLLGHIGVTDRTLSQALTRFSGGNPLFLLETVKHLIETRGLAGPWPQPLPLTEQVGQIISRRLARLSPPALQVARAAAVLQRDFNPELIAEVLNAPLLEVARVWDELEAAQVMQGDRFAHDLVYEAVRAGLSGTVQGLLHRAAARTLARHEASAARVARHWLAGGKPEAAVTSLQRAAQDARDQFQLAEAAGFYAEAAQLLLELGERGAAADAWAARAQVLGLAEASQLTV